MMERKLILQEICLVLLISVQSVSGRSRSRFGVSRRENSKFQISDMSQNGEPSTSITTEDDIWYLGNSAHRPHQEPYHPNQIVKEPRPCPGCAESRNRIEAELSSDTLRKLRLERIKERILHKMGLTEPPHVSGVNSLPDPLLSLSINSSDQARRSGNADEFYAKTERVILLSEVGLSYWCPRRRIPSSCLTFTLPYEIFKGKPDLRVRSAELWVYPTPVASNPERVFTIAEISLNGTEMASTSLDPRHRINSSAGWESMNVSNTVGAWMGGARHLIMERDHPPLRLQIRCRACSTSNSPIDVSKSTNRPFLVINMAETVQKKRRRRNSDCTGSNGGCCREEFKVNFEEMGWQGWIFQPKEYNAYYCKGHCMGNDPSQSQLRRGHRATYYYYVNKRSPNWTDEILPCCTPKKFSSQSLGFKDDNGTLIVRSLANMVVESCGCAGDSEIS